MGTQIGKPEISRQNSNNLGASSNNEHSHSPKWTTPDFGRRHSLAIDKLLQQESRTQRTQIVIILLGPENAGKTTIMKQIRLLHGGTLDKTEILAVKTHIRALIVQASAFLIEMVIGISFDGSMQSMLFLYDFSKLKEAGKISDDVCKSEDMIILREAKATCNGVSDMHHPWGPLAPVLLRLWSLPEITEFYEKSRDAMIAAAIEATSDPIQRLMSRQDVHYLLTPANLSRICTMTYNPTTADMLQLKTDPSGGINELRYDVNGILYRIVDSSGLHRNNLKKWILCFQGVTAAVFIVATSDYDRRELSERTHQKENMLLETLEYFKAICTSELFHRTTMLIFFNKMDLLRAKLPKIPFTVAYPTYAGEQEAEPVVTFLCDQFITEKTKSEVKTVLAFHITATCTENMDTIINETIIDTVLRKTVNVF